MNTIWNIVVFLFFINISAGIFSAGLDLQSNINYDSQMSSDSNIFNVNTNTTESPVSIPSVEENNLFDWTSAFLNVITLGFLSKIANFFVNYLFGFTTIIHNLFPMVSNNIIYFFNVIIGLLYAFGLVSLFGGKKIDNQ